MEEKITKKVEDQLKRHYDAVAKQEKAEVEAKEALLKKMTETNEKELEAARSSHEKELAVQTKALKEEN